MVQADVRPMSVRPRSVQQVDRLVSFSAEDMMGPGAESDRVLCL